MSNVDEKHHCPHCSSPDTVDYWAKSDGKDLFSSVLRHYYPDARKCVDCESVYSESAEKKRAIMAAIALCATDFEVVDRAAMDKINAAIDTDLKTQHNRVGPDGTP